jgi:hypothetical protein
MACVAVASAPLTLSACGGGSHSAGNSSVTTTSGSSSRDAPTSTSSPSTPSSRAAGNALAAYRGMWANMVVAARTADYQDPILAQHASGAALSTLVQGLYSYRQQGLVIMGTPVTHPTVTSLTPSADPTQANVSDCFDDTHWLAYKATGGLENNAPGGHRQVSAVVTDLNGIWKVTQLNTGAEGSC